jgi:hypothetical protein
MNYALITGKTPVGLQAADGVTAADAAALQAIAAEVVLGK